VGDFEGVPVVVISVFDLPLLVACVSEVVFEVLFLVVPQAVSNAKNPVANNIFKFFIAFVFLFVTPNLQITVITDRDFKKRLWNVGLGMRDWGIGISLKYLSAVVE